MKSYLITGGAGFIGSNFVKFLLEKHSNINIIILDSLTYAGNVSSIAKNLGNHCHFVEGDINDRAVVEQIFAKTPINYVVNFAAESHVDRSIDNPQLFLTTNILGTQNLLEVAKQYWSQGRDESGYPIWNPDVKFVQISTDEVYGSLGEKGYFTESTQLDPHSPYSASKAGADLIVKAYADTYKMPINITRCSNNYGPYQLPEKLIPLTIKNILEGKAIPVYGDGTNIRDWLYVNDHCKAIDLVIENGTLGEVYNVGGNNERKNIDVLRIIIATIRRLMEENPNYLNVLKRKEIKADGKLSTDWINENLISYVKDRLGHDKRYAIDPAKIKLELGWRPETTFEEGIVDTVKWYLDNQAWVEEVTNGDYQEYYDKMYNNR